MTETTCGNAPLTMIISRISLDLILCEIVRSNLSDEALDRIGDEVGLRYTERAIREKVDCRAIPSPINSITTGLHRADLSLSLMPSSICAKNYGTIFFQKQWIRYI